MADAIIFMGTTGIGSGESLTSSESYVFSSWANKNRPLGVFLTWFVHDHWAQYHVSMTTRETSWCGWSPWTWASRAGTGKPSLLPVWVPLISQIDFVSLKGWKKSKGDFNDSNIWNFNFNVRKLIFIGTQPCPFIFALVIWFCAIVVELSIWERNLITCKILTTLPFIEKVCLALSYIHFKVPYT